jgi:hypothetical protein
MMGPATCGGPMRLPLRRVAAFVIGLVAFAMQAPPAPAQAGASGDLSQMPQRAQEIALLKQLIADVETQKRIALTPLGTGSYGQIMIVDRDQVGGMATWYAQNGMIAPDSIQSWVGKQLATSRQILGVMKEQLARLEAGQGWTPPPPSPGPTTVDVPTAQVGSVYWPTPMDWLEVGGRVRGTYSIQCYSDDDRLPLLRGTFVLELRGKGIAFGSFTDTGDGVTEEMNGTISDTGLAFGSAQSTLAMTGWSARFVRAGNDLRVQDPKLAMAPKATGTRCDPGVVEQTS